LSLSSLPWYQHQPQLSGCRARGLAAFGKRPHLRVMMLDLSDQETDAGAIAAAEAIRAAACDDGQEAPLRALTLKSEPGLPMTLRSASVSAFASSYGAGIAAIRSSPIPQSWLLGTAPKRQCPIDASG
jgi:hypothetical protein